MTRRIRQRYIVAGCSLIFAIGCVVFLIIAHHPRALPLPAGIIKELNFSTILPDKSWTITTVSASYQGGVLRFTGKQGDLALSFSEQATPPTFSEIPQYYPALLEKLNQYHTFDSPLGTVYLTKPTELRGGQTAVLESKGTLCFIRPSRSMGDDEWQQLFAAARIAGR